MESSDNEEWHEVVDPENQENQLETSEDLHSRLESASPLEITIQGKKKRQSNLHLIVSHEFYLLVWLSAFRHLNSFIDSEILRSICLSLLPKIGTTWQKINAQLQSLLSLVADSNAPTNLFQVLETKEASYVDYVLVSAGVFSFPDIRLFVSHARTGDKIGGVPTTTPLQTVSTRIKDFSRSF